MNSAKYERRLLGIVFLLCIGLFGNLALLQDPIDKTPLILAAILIVFTCFAYFVIRKFYPDGDKYFLIFAAVLSMIGIAVLYRLGLTIKTDQGKAIRQLMYFAAGLTCYILIVVVIPDLRSFARYRYVYMVFTLIFMGMALAMGVDTINGSKNWVRFGGFGFQPSEIGKIFLVLYLASALHKFEDKENVVENFKQLIEPAAIVMASLGFMVLQKDLGSALLFFGIAVTVLYISTSKVKYLITCLGLFIVGAVISYQLFGHVRQRVLIWAHLWDYANTKSYQLVQGLYSISSGGAFGVGFKQGLPQYIPERATDMIYAVICEELGMVFAVGIMLIYFLLFYRGMRAALATSDKFSQLSAVGFSTMIVMQVLVIIGGVFSIIPLTGITLPLISYGGTSMLTMFFALGILQKISEEEY